MKTGKLFAFFLVALLCAGAAGAQGFWEKKEWKSWSKEECRKLLEDSPWAQKWSRGDVSTDRFGQPTSGTGRVTEPQVYYFVQLRSALPVRQAFIRSVQLQNGYDKMSPEQKKQFDASADSYLARKYDDVIVVHITYGSNVEIYAKEMKRIWQGYAPDAPPHNITMITSTGTRVLPLKLMNAPGGAQEFELIFPRVVNGEQILTSTVKSVAVEFPHPDLEQMAVRADPQATSSEKVTAAAQVNVNFKVERMVVRGQVVY